MDEDFLNSSPLPVLSLGLSRKEELKNKEKEDNLKYRFGLVLWTTILTSLYLIFVAIFLIIYANKNDFKFSENLVITLLATTTVTVLGLPAIVLKGLFPIRLNNKNQTK